MSKPRSKVVDYAVYIIVRIGVCVLQMLNWDQARAVARGLAWLAYHIDRRHTEVARENLRQAYPGQYTDAEINQLVKRVYLHFCMLVMEIIFLPRKLHVCNYKKHIRFVDEEPLVHALLSGRPLLIVTCHFGNWELAGYVLGLCGFATYAVARTLDNPYLDSFLRRFREHNGQRILAKKGDFDKMTDVLASGGVLATLGDQDAGRRGTFVEFFGRPASTHKAIALMAIEYEVPIIVSAARKVGDPLRYEIVTSELIDPRDFTGQANAVQAITQQFTNAMEKLIRTAPEQYFWLHRRWKTEPPTKKGKKAA